MTAPFRIAQIEARSWGSNPRRYAINSFGLRGESAQIDIIKPWESVEKGYHLFLISDDLCLSRLPFYIPKCQRIALLKESHLLPGIYEPEAAQALLDRFNLIITHHNGLVATDRRFTLVPYSSNMLDLTPYNSRPKSVEASEKKQLCSAVISLGSDSFVSPSLFLRQQVIQFLSKYKLVDLYGKSSNPIEHKVDALAPYAFSIAMENIVSPTYFTEKLIDCILSGTIPIYHGSRSTLNYFDKRGILFFDSLEELKSILEELSYDRYIALSKYARINFDAAIHLKLADYNGYLHRVCDAIASTTQVSDLAPFRITTSLMSKLKASFRRGASFL